MQEMEIDFSWPVAERYEIKKIRPPKEIKPLKRGTIRASSTIAAGPNPIVPYRIFARGEVTWKRPPLEKLPLATVLLGTYRRFQDEPDQLQKTVLEFAGAYGLLLLTSEEGKFEPLDLWQDLIDDLIALHKAFEKGQWRLSASKLDVANIRAALIPDPLTRAPRLAFRPTSLQGAIQLQMAHRVARGAMLKTCRQCGAYFEAGIKGKRGDAKFCSEPCRYSYNNKRRSA
jgi:hypothetical protein